MSELAAVKEALTEMKTAFADLQKVNDAKIEALKAGRSGADFDEKLDRITEVMNKHEKMQRDFHRQQEAAELKRNAEELEWRAKRDADERKMESRINRHLLGLGGGSGDDVGANELLARKAYNTFMRKGVDRMGDDEKKVLLVSNDTTGGYLAPPTFVQNIIKAVVLFSPMRDLVNVVTIGTGELQQPKRTGTSAATRVGETSTRTESTNPSWGLVKIGAPEMYAEARISNVNLEDSAFDLEKELTDDFSEQFGVTEGNEVINGNGVNKCLGILDASAAGPSTPIAYTASGSSATIAGASGSMADGLINLFHSVKTAYAANGRWALNRLSLGKVRLLKDTTGQYLWQPGVAVGMPNSILGAPYTECPDMPDEAANAFPIAFGDWKRAYTLTERIDMAITRDPLTLANVGQVKFFARRRVGGQVVLGEALRLLKCATS
jgi:HK97 family phage major capsid protein